MAGLRSFPRHKRLLTPTQFKRVFSSNRRLSNRHWTVLYRPNDAGFDRLGMAVSKKRAKKAVDRNRLKRAVRESFRHRLVNAGLDIVVLPREATVAIATPDLRASLDRLWCQLEQRSANNGGVSRASA